MGAAIERVVGDDRIPGLQGLELPLLNGPHQGQHALPHGAQMNGDVRSIGHQTSPPVKEGTGEIQPLFDVHRDAGLLQTGAHLLGNRHEAMAEQLQIDRVRISGLGLAGLKTSRCIETQEQFAPRQAARTPGRGQQVGACGLTDQGRTLNALTRGDLGALPKGGGPPGAIQEDRDAPGPLGLGGDGIAGAGASHGTGPAELQAEAIDDDLGPIAAGEVAVALLELGDELLPQPLRARAGLRPRHCQALVPAW